MTKITGNVSMLLLTVLFLLFMWVELGQHWISVDEIPQINEKI